jgi:hypothetical protein
MITRRHLQNKRVIADNREEGETMDKEATQLERGMIIENGKDSEEVMDMQCGQQIEWETDGISESRGERPTSTDKNGKDNPTDVQTIMLCMKEMFREIRKENEKMREEFRKESEKRAKEWNERMESIFAIHERGILSSLNQTAREVE